MTANPTAYRCGETCECLCGHCWDKRHVTTTLKARIA